MKCKQADALMDVICWDEYRPFPGCRITLIDRCGKELCCALTNCRGRARLPVYDPGEYQLRVESSPCHSPKAQNRWFHISCSERLCFSFIFHRTLCY
ncbi:MAG: hypothetical protein E7518_03865 [Ruminococcaceae bacterium]|nr:hypothetical protein [Oscillospiraceae bacterium]